MMNWVRFPKCRRAFPRGYYRVLDRSSSLMLLVGRQMGRRHSCEGRARVGQLLEKKRRIGQGTWPHAGNGRRTRTPTGGLLKEDDVALVWPRPNRSYDALFPPFSQSHVEKAASGHSFLSHREHFRADVDADYLAARPMTASTTGANRSSISRR